MISALTSEVTCPPMYSVGGLMWTVNERQRLMNAYAKAPKERLLVLFPDRSWDAIMTQASRLRIPRPGLKWTPEEDGLLVELRGRGLSYRKMAEHFKNRGPMALKNRAYILRKAGVKK